MRLRDKLLGYYDYTVVLTYCGMLFAVTGIFFALSGAFCRSILCLMFAGCCDMFDGAVASTKDRTPPEKLFGIQIDSLSDLISFGVLPGIFVYCITDYRLNAAVCAAFFILAALIRLAYFNVLEEERQKQTTEKRDSYLGVPVTTIAMLLPLLYILNCLDIVRNVNVFSMILLLMAIGFLYPLHIKKPHGSAKLALAAVGVAELIAVIICSRL